MINRLFNYFDSPCELIELKREIVETILVELKNINVQDFNIYLTDFDRFSDLVEYEDTLKYFKKFLYILTDNRLFEYFSENCDELDVVEVIYNNFNYFNKNLLNLFNYIMSTSLRYCWNLLADINTRELKNILNNSSTFGFSRH